METTGSRRFQTRGIPVWFQENNKVHFDSVQLGWSPSSIFFFNLSGWFWCPARLENLWTSLFPQPGAGQLPRQIERGDLFLNLLQLRMNTSVPKPRLPQLPTNFHSLLVPCRQYPLAFPSIENHESSTLHTPCVCMTLRVRKIYCTRRNQEVVKSKQTHREIQDPTNAGCYRTNKPVSLHKGHATTIT